MLQILLQIWTSPSNKHTLKITIRKIERKDCHRLMELIHELAVYEKAPHEMTVTLNHFTESGFGKSPVWWGFVAEVDNIVQGFALYYIRYSTWKGQRMYLEDFLVTNEMRGKGLGKLLFDSLLQEARDKNLNGIAWQVLDWNKPAINFYKKYADVQFENGWLNCSTSTLIK